MRTLLALALILLGPTDDGYDKLIQHASYPLSAAIEKGLAQAPATGGVVVEVELESEGDVIQYALDIALGKGLLALDLDAKTGAVLESEEESDEDCSAVVAAAKITLSDAIATALRESPGHAVYAALELHDGKALAEVRVYKGGALATVWIDAVRGAVLEHGGVGREEGDEEGDEDEDADEDAEEGDDDSPTFTLDFGERAEDLGPTGRNPYFVLEPGYVLRLEGEEDGEKVAIEILVLDETKRIDGVETRVVQESEWTGGELDEITRDFFAISARTNNVYYFGEEVDVYEDGKVKHHEGSWLSGVDGAHYGLLMPGVPLLGARYQQEHAPGKAMDRGEVVALGESFECPAGTFANVLRTRETTALDASEQEYKRYARGVGLIQDQGLRLVSAGPRTGR